MHIICLVKVVPNVEEMRYNPETQSLIRENVKLIVNPDDNAAVALALSLQKQRPEQITIEIVTMGPANVAAPLKDFLRLGCQKVTILSDRAFAGSDSYATAKIISAYLEKQEYSFILSGTNALDGDTGHIPSQIAEKLNLPVLVGITKVEQQSLFEKKAQVEVEGEDDILSFSVSLPAVLGISRESKLKLPYIRFDDLNKNVEDQIQIVTNETLGLSPQSIGLKGSLTIVTKAFAKPQTSIGSNVFACDEEGMQQVLNYLVKEGFVSGK